MLITMESLYREISAFALQTRKSPTMLYLTVEELVELNLDTQYRQMRDRQIQESTCLFPELLPPMKPTKSIQEGDRLYGLVIKLVKPELRINIVQ